MFGLYTLFLSLFLLMLPSLLVSQQEYECSQSAYGFSQLDQGLYEISINPSNSALQFKAIKADLGVELEAMAYHPNDNMLYAIGIIDRALYRIDSNGNTTKVNNLNLRQDRFYLAGEIHPSGTQYYLVESDGVRDNSLIVLDLQDFSIVRIPFNVNTSIRDICFDVHANLLYAYDSNNNQMLRISESGVGSFFLNLSPSDEFQSVFSDAFGQIWAVGSTAFGVASGLFRIDTESDTYSRWTTGPESLISDMTACPYGVIMNVTMTPENSLPCQEISVEIRLANGGIARDALSLNLPIIEGFEYLEIRSSSLTFEDQSDPSLLSLDNITLPKSVESIDILIEADDIPAGEYEFQGGITSNDNNDPLSIFSDNPLTVRPEDYSKVNINRIEEDTIYEERFLCLGQGIVLDPSDYSSLGEWSNGFEGVGQEIFEEGLFTFDVREECQEFTIQYDITQASCPFTLALEHWIMPTEILQCSEITFGYIFENSTGIAQNNVNFEQDLPFGFEFIEFTKNPFGQEVDLDSLPDKIYISNITMQPGFDTLEIKVFVSESAPGPFASRAKLSGFPSDLGPIRFSDDPNTQEFDSTTVNIIGTLSDSLVVEVAFCNDKPVVLNGSPYGIEYLWPDGSTDSTFLALNLGNYELEVFSGCKTSYVFFEVVEALDIRLNGNVDLQIHQGEEVSIFSTISNEGNELEFYWESEEEIPCDDCSQFFVQPLEDATYKLVASNEECSDSLIFNVSVDQDRRLYFPTAFSPNKDGINDLFLFQTPDFAEVEFMRIYDKWGNQVYEHSDNNSTGWNGETRNKDAANGVYFWQAKIRFIDGQSKSYSGELTLVR